MFEYLVKFLNVEDQKRVVKASGMLLYTLSNASMVLMKYSKSDKERLCVNSKSVGYK